MTFAPTPQQEAFLSALRTTTSNIALEARAGCGKTSTLLLGVDVVRDLNARNRVILAAFNKAIVEEVETKLTKAGHGFPHVQAKTAHGLGLSLLKDAGIDTRRGLNAHKVRDLITAAGQSDGLYRDYASTISKLVSQAKQAALGVFGSASDVERWQGLADHYGIELEDAYASRIIAAAQDVYTRSCADRETFDFDDMILLPLLAKLSSRFPADFLFVDEAQDLSPARQALLAKFVKPKFGRLIVVGDPAQAIYGFAGADARAFQNLISDWRCTVLPLSVTFRCPKAVVAEAQKIVPDITAADSAPEGVVRGEASLPPVLVPGEDAILCRNTAPLISQAYALIRAGIPAKVEGRDIGEGLAALARRWKVRTCAELLARLDAHQEREAAKLAKRPDGEEQVERLADRLDTLREIVFACQAKGLQLVTDVTSAIADLFGDDVSKTKAAVTLATYHRSKGREWERVFLLEHAARCPSRAARQQWQLEQEYNLAYVAITRAKRELVYVG